DVVPSAEHLGAERDGAVKGMQEIRQDAAYVGHDEVNMSRHRAEGVHVHAVATGYDGGEVEQNLSHARVRAQDDVPEDHAKRDQVRGVGEDLAGLAHDPDIVKDRSNSSG